MIEKTLCNKLQYFLTVSVSKENESSCTPEVEEINLAKRLKGLVAVLQHIAEEDDVHPGTPLTPL